LPKRSGKRPRVCLVLDVRSRLSAKKGELRIMRCFSVRRKRESGEIETAFMTEAELLQLNAGDLLEIYDWWEGNEVVSVEKHGSLETMALILPGRLYKEDLGDALESLARLERLGAPRWKRRLKAGSTFVWLFLNGVREVVSALRGNTGSAAQRKDQR
jgi:hypothetical protein